MKIVKVTDPEQKSFVCNSILRSLPLWFGIESAIVDYVKDVQTMETFVAFDKDVPVGFISIHRHFPESAEIHVMGVLESYHGQGIGQNLIKHSENELRQLGVKFFSVKTLSESRPNREYDQTRKFYFKVGFVPLQEFKTLWGSANPCLLMVKSL